MAWEHLSINKPHLAYMIVGGFTSLFMLCSLFVKEKLYIGEATMATLCGVIFGPHAANLFNPLSWGNTDQITLECSRIVLVVQCFAIGVELPKSYMERHWRSVVFLLVPVMTYGWLMTSLFIWWMVEPLSWLESLACAACVTATDPVLASSVVGKGTFAKRVPKHLRDILSAESGCNDGMAFPFIYLSVYLIRYQPNANEVAYHWIVYTILYECIFGAVYGFLIGYIGRHLIKSAEKRGLIDRESFLVFYFVLALFCAGSGSLLGMDDLLIGFSAGVGFSNDGWFTEKTEESHVSNVIDLLLNLAYFVYLGAIIPWNQYNAPSIGLVPWRLVVISLFVIFFRRIPIMLALKPIIPDVKTWREALFAGHFGPIGVGAIFAAILARAELENEGTEPLAVLPGPGSENYTIVNLIWPITTFMVISSIMVHGSSIAVFTLGKRINTLTITMSYTQANEDGPTWMNRLPRISSQSRTSQSFRKAESFETSDASNEKLPEYPPGTLPPIGLPGNFLRRQKEEDNPSNPNSRPSSLKPTRRQKWDSRKGPGGPISLSAVFPLRRPNTSPAESGSDTHNEQTDQSPESRPEIGESTERLQDDEKRMPDELQPEEAEVEPYQEGDEMIVEDKEGNVLSHEDTKDETEQEKQQHILEQKDSLRKETSGEHAKSRHHPHEKTEGEEIVKAVDEAAGHPARNLRKRLGAWREWGKHKGEGEPSEAKPARTSKLGPERKRGPAHAYQFGNTIIVEDEDGEVVKKYTLPSPEKPRKSVSDGRAGNVVGGAQTRQRLQRVGTRVGLGGGKDTAEAPSAAPAETGDDGEARTFKRPNNDDEDNSSDDGLRFTLSRPGIGHSGRRMSKVDFIKQIRQLDPKARCEVVEESDALEEIKHAAREEAKRDEEKQQGRARSGTGTRPPRRSDTARSTTAAAAAAADVQHPPLAETGHGALDVPVREASLDSHPSHDSDEQEEEIPTHDITASLARFAHTSAAQRRRQQLASLRKDSEDDGTPRVTPPRRRGATIMASSGTHHEEIEGETAAEKRRRLAALGKSKDGSDSEDDGEPRAVKGKIQFADGTKEASRRDQSQATMLPLAPSPPAAVRVQWGGERGREAEKSGGNGNSNGRGRRK